MEWACCAARVANRIHDGSDAPVDAEGASTDGEYDDEEEEEDDDDDDNNDNDDDDDDEEEEEEDEDGDGDNDSVNEHVEGDNAGGGGGGGDGAVNTEREWGGDGSDGGSCDDNMIYVDMVQDLQDGGHRLAKSYDEATDEAVRGEDVFLADLFSTAKRRVSQYQRHQDSAPFRVQSGRYARIPFSRILGTGEAGLCEVDGYVRSEWW